MSTTRNITNSIKIVERSIRKHSTTADTNREGYLVQNGTNRTLCTAVDTEGDLQVYAETNGDPAPLSEENAADFCRTIGDNCDLQSGIDRLAAIVDEIRDESSDAADWIDDCIAAARAELLTPDEQNDAIGDAINAVLGKLNQGDLTDAEFDSARMRRESLFMAICDATQPGDGPAQIRATVERLAR